jgi:hypothetical protein
LYHECERCKNGLFDKNLIVLNKQSKGFFMAKREESYYNEHAKPGCGECRGKGMVIDFSSQDSSTLEPCSTCFPDDPEVVRLKEARARWEVPNGKIGIIAVPVP